MGLVVNTNVTALIMQRNLAKTTTEIGTYMERLSTGFRVNSATDDAAGLALSESLESQISASNSVIRDADIAVEAASLTRTQILQQASASLLQQANQPPSLALSLL